MFRLFATLCRVQALAICFSRTVGELEFTSLARTTTVTTVECATAVVVVYIAVAVTFVVRFSAVTGTFFQSFRVRAFAFLAVRELIFIVTLPAAVSTVPIAATVIVLIVATSIAHV